MASVTVNRKGKVTSVKNGKHSNSKLTNRYTVGKSSSYRKSSHSAGSNGFTARENPYSGSNVSSDTPAIGSMDAPHYGLNSNDVPVIGSMDNNSPYMSNPSDDEIRGLAKNTPYSEDNPGGYAGRDGLNGNTYNAKQTAYVFKDDKGLHTVYSNYTNYKDAMNAATASGKIGPNATLERASTYGTASLGNKKGYNYGGITGGNGHSGFGSDGYISDKQYGNMYDQTNMQLSYLSGRDGKDYTNPYAGLVYNGNGMNNAYLKGIENYGSQPQANSQAGLYDMPQPKLDNSALSNYGSMQHQNSNINDTMNSVLDNYNNAVEDNNSAITSAYNYQKRRNEQDAEDNARALYVQRMIAEKNLPEQLASQGISGGLTESTMAELHSNYQNAYNENQQNLSNVNAQLENSKQQALANNNMTAAQYVSQIQQTTLQLQQSAQEAQRAYELSLTQMAQARDESDRAYAMQSAQYNLDLANQQYSRNYAELQDQIKLAYQLGDYDTVNKLTGIDTTAAKQLQSLDMMKKQLSYNSSLSNYQKKTKPISRVSKSGSDDNFSDEKLIKTPDEIKTTRKTGTPVLSDYAKGVYTDLIKSGYGTSEIDDKITQEYQKGYITKNEADMLARQLLGV